jgi:serine/threonine protein kinase
MSFIKIAEGSHSSVYINQDNRTITKIINDDKIALREMKFLSVVTANKCQNVLVPLYINKLTNSVIFKKLTPIGCLPFLLLNKYNKNYIVEQLINGIYEIHSMGIIHNDLKLDNILYDPASLEVKIIDFSTSLFNNEKICITGGTTPLYECPESNRSYKSDIWSLGICILKLFGMHDNVLKKLRLMSKKSINEIVYRNLKNKNNLHLINFALGCLNPNPENRISVDFKHSNSFNI